MKIEIIKTVKEIQSITSSLRKKNLSIGFVPTMGYLHKGHISLVKESKVNNDITIASIFVNPTQFAPNEDLAKYPRDIEKDIILLENENVDYLFLPEVDELYPSGFDTVVSVPKISSIIEGEFRPDHFKGVSTIVTILFNCVNPTNTYFGQKDAQQAAIIRRLIADLKMDINIVVKPIIRENDGLAMSSRNVYLNSNERQKALILFKSLTEAELMIKKGEFSTKVIIKKINSFFIKETTVHLNYIRIVNSLTFEEVEVLKPKNQYYILLACRIGSTRLIDNLLINL